MRIVTLLLGWLLAARAVGRTLRARPPRVRLTVWLDGREIARSITWHVGGTPR